MITAGLDIGTTTISAVVLDNDHREVIRAWSIENGSWIKTEHEWERIQDAELIFQKAGKLLERIVREYPGIAAVGLTRQMHGILYVNEEGKALSPLYTWEDGRGNRACYDGKSAVDAVYDLTGLKTATGYGLITHYYNLRKGLVPEGAAAVCTIGDYIGMRLTGRRTPLLHTGNAASLGFFDVANGCFLTDAIRLTGMDIDILPEVTDQFAALGEWRGIPVKTAIGDNQASFLGAVKPEEGNVLINMGTGGQISMLSHVPVFAAGIETRPILPGQYLLVGSSLCGGRAYAILEHFFREYAAAAGAPDVPQYPVMEKLAAEAMSRLSDELPELFSPKIPYVESTFMGTREDPQRKAKIENLDENSFTPGLLIIGLMQGMARELYAAYETMQKETGVRAFRLVGSGNGLRKNLLLQSVFSSVFGREMELSPCEEEAACGAAAAC